MPLIGLIVAALMFEPLRSGFALESQPCELAANWEQMARGVFNVRHIIGFGTICLAALFTFQKNPIVNASAFTLVFSILLEFQQSFFPTGHCRSWDLPPNLLAVGLANIAYLTFIKLVSSGRNN